MQIPKPPMPNPMIENAIQIQVESRLYPISVSGLTASTLDMMIFFFLPNYQPYAMNTERTKMNKCGCNFNANALYIGEHWSGKSLSDWVYRP